MGAVGGLAVLEVKGILEISSKLRPLKVEEKYSASQICSDNKVDAVVINGFVEGSDNLGLSAKATRITV